MPQLRPVLVGGHESRQGADLERLLAVLPGALVTAPGRALHDRVRALLESGAGPIAVLPMTWGRDPVAVADTARTLHWLSTGTGTDAARGRLALCEPFGTIDHLVALLRMAATRTVAAQPDAALVIAAPRADPFDDAELHRVAHLVRTHGAGLEVAVACVDTDADLAHAVGRERLLGADGVVVVPAGFAESSPAPAALDGASFYGPLLSDRAMARIVEERVATAVHELDHGRDGIDEGLEADHGHGYAHSHESVPGSGAHPHTHGHQHQHQHHDVAAALAPVAPGPTRADAPAPAHL
ncbi:sirohydrochlorin chelatase [Cellulomonas sp. P22]